jgi:hypothetical protein
VFDAHPTPGCVDDVFGARGGIVPLGPENPPPPTPAGPYVGALAGAFRVEPTPAASGLGAEIDEMRGFWFVFAPASIDDPDGPTIVIWIPIVLAEFPVNILFPFGYEVFRRL